MNQDQIKGNVKDSAGKIQEKAGRMFDSKEHEAKGQEKQGEAKVDKAVGGAKDVFNK